MSQYGYGYGPPQGYQPPDAYSHAPPPAYAPPPYQSSETTQAQQTGHGSVTLESFEYNRQTIPGLGLNFSNNAVGWQQAWPNGASELQAERPQAGQAEHVPTMETFLRSVPASQARPTVSQIGNDTVEEGELSEGELEDIYEPGQAEDLANGRPHLDGQPLSPEALDRPGEVPAQPQAVQTVGKDAVTTRYWDPEQSARERSGSYSPYLSPREIHSNGQANSPSDAVDTPRSELHQEMPNRPMDLDDSEQQFGLPDESKHISINEAKQRAQDAILRLWPLNIRYQNYLDEGIDRQLLDGLFTELGLDSTGTKSVTELPATSPSTQPQELPKDAHRVENNGKQSDHTNRSSDEAAKPKDKSEERKDRIARLLAAKGSKAAAAVPEVSATPVVPTAPSAMIPNKTQSEKSKLIQQKMEALRKSREANANKSSQTEGSATPATDSSLPRPPALPTAPGFDNTSVLDDSAVVADQPPATFERSESHGAPPIPGLFLSSTPQASPPVNQRKRPVAADLNEYSTVAAYKRPFGQNRESRPFLIDVSDDEDDAEMEIDSPELRPSSIHRPLTPTGKTASFRDHPALSDNISNRQLSSPKATGTPTGQGGTGNGLYDLESMNKKIEDMKRKIAEAEAPCKKKSGFEKKSSIQSQIRNRKMILNQRMWQSIETMNPSVPTNEEQEGAEFSRTENANISTNARTYGEDVDVTGGQGFEEETSSTRHASVADHAATSTDDAVVTADDTSAPEEVAEPGDSNLDPETDVAMEEDADSSSEEDDGGSSDGYEPTEAGVDILHPQSPAKSTSWSPPPPGEDAVLETSDTDLQGVSATSPITQPISAADGDSASVSESGREVDLLYYKELSRTLTLKQVGPETEVAGSGAPKSTFAPYETPLHYFRAYRFHPKFKDSVAGGLRSLTYSNKIDVKREVCPDQLAGAVCPRGTQCEFQHFENMKAPDDQILLQLGAYGNYEGEQKQKYITGLRDLLTGFRNRKIKDFQAISEGIIEYRAQFHGDKTKILPLGSVAI
ncbi:hypothetical protein G7Z17_g9773 [Cylindrodendrum hubeiense]|uniref:C3H1-type domain-containing protein n=1 Tax=Cylindrodendrum hubeiense TaxID=595255 RepID=A0A9P5L5D7_9HYPO|nr:hypothetical protein G7Z17_g9773 [Cylindrodendrum hubeiense]